MVQIVLLRTDHGRKRFLQHLCLGPPPGRPPHMHFAKWVPIASWLVLEELFCQLALFGVIRHQRESQCEWKLVLDMHKLSFCLAEAWRKSVTITLLLAKHGLASTRWWWAKRTFMFIVKNRMCWWTGSNNARGLPTVSPPRNRTTKGKSCRCSWASTAKVNNRKLPVHSWVNQISSEAYFTGTTPAVRRRSEAYMDS